MDKYYLLDDINSAINCLEEATSYMDQFPSEMFDVKEVVNTLTEKRDELMRKIIKEEAEDEEALEREYFADIL